MSDYDGPGADPPGDPDAGQPGPDPDRLARVTTPVARSVEIRWDRDCDGTAEVLQALALPAQVDSTSPPNAPGPTQSGPSRIRSAVRQPPPPDPKTPSGRRR